MDVLGFLSGQHKDDDATAQEDSTLTCSRKGCKAEASYVLEWNNPKVHSPDRRKQWLTCNEHREYLSEFLNARLFLKNVVPVATLHTAQAHASNEDSATQREEP